MDQHLHVATKKGKLIDVDPAIDSAFLDDVCQRTEGFSGRQLAKLVLAYQAAVFGSGTSRLTPGLAETVLNYKLNNRDDDVNRQPTDNPTMRRYPPSIIFLLIHAVRISSQVCMLV